VNVEIVTIGDELLLGFTVDTNAAHIARALAGEGIAISRRSTVGDDERAIAAAVADALVRADGVITTGGLGPTSDDRSKPAVAVVFGRAMVFDGSMLDALRERWKSRGLGELPVTNRNQAMVPEGATLLQNRHGSAAGIWLENEAHKWVAMLPGVPREMRGMLEDELIPRLRALGAGRGEVVASRTLRTTGVPESRIADLISGLPLPPAVTLSYLPAWEGVDLRVTIRGVAREIADERLAQAAAAVRAPLGDIVYGEDGADLAAVVLDALRARGWTIGVGESCTGGMLGMRLTAVPGASDVVRGGVIAYDNSVKTTGLHVRAITLDEHGAVSDEIAAEMARGARAATGADVGVGITGVAGPGGGTPSKPVGTVAIAVDGGGSVRVVSARFVGDRDEVRRRATQAALMMVLRLCRWPHA
jgi:nicotinamide-nucleotide amidase